MRIKDKLDYETKPKPFTLKPSALVKDALDEMCEKNFGSVIIVDDDEKLVGILTERDMMRRVLHKGVDIEKTAVEDVMSTPVRAAQESDELIDWIRIMTTKRFRHLPVVDERGRVVSMMSQGDFVFHTWPDLFEHARKTVKEKLGLPFQFLMIVIAFFIIGLLIFEKIA